MGRIAYLCIFYRWWFVSNLKFWMTHRTTAFTWKKKNDDVHSGARDSPRQYSSSRKRFFPETRFPYQLSRHEIQVGTKRNFAFFTFNNNNKNADPVAAREAWKKQKKETVLPTNCGGEIYLVLTTFWLKFKKSVIKKSLKYGSRSSRIFSSYKYSELRFTFSWNFWLFVTSNK